MRKWSERGDLYFSSITFSFSIKTYFRFIKSFYTPSYTFLYSILQIWCRVIYFCYDFQRSYFELLCDVVSGKTSKKLQSIAERNILNNLIYRFFHPFDIHLLCQIIYMMYIHEKELKDYCDFCFLIRYIF